MELHQLDRAMKRLLPLCALFLLGAAPSRTQTYVAGAVISPTAVTENEDNIFSYLQAGVDTLRASAATTTSIKDGEIVNADISSSAAIAYSKLSLTNSVTGTDIAMGSDAQGDVLYYNGTDWARLGAGTSGQFLKTNGAGANPAWASSAISAYVGSFTKDQTDASGSTTAVTAPGFTPKFVIFLAGQQDTSESSWGFDDGTTAAVMYDINGAATDVYNLATGVSIRSLQTATASYSGNITSLDANGFTVTWTRASTPSGTMTVYYVAVK